jgi:hypothetical protein
MKVSLRLPNHASGWFSTFTLLTIGFYWRIRMMRTVVEAIDECFAFAYACVDKLVGFLDETLVEHAARYTRLVCHNNDLEASMIEESYRINAPRVEHNTIKPVKISNFLDQRTITIEKDGRGHEDASIISFEVKHLARALKTSSVEMPVMQR